MPATPSFFLKARPATSKQRGMGRIKRVLVPGLAAILIVGAAPGALAGTPGWAKPAVKYLKSKGWLDGGDWHPNWAMKRAEFKELMRRSFGKGYYHRTAGKVTAGEVSKALVKALGLVPVSENLEQASSPDGWKPKVSEYFGDEIVVREVGLRHDRPTWEDEFEASAAELIRGADIAYAVYKAKTDPSMYSADVLRDFDFSRYGNVRKQVVQFAVSLVGTPYVWAGEWPRRTPDGYPYGAQVHGGFDCSGFVWYVLKAQNSSYRPIGRPYKGWTIPERSSADMARATKKRLGKKEFEPGDIVFFAPNGTKSKASDVYHAGMYLGGGWMIHSSGSRAGISIADISKGSWWRDQILWGRRIIK
jgi:NlpC/P60 family